MRTKLLAIITPIISISIIGTASATGFIQDDAALFSHETVSQVSRKIDQTYKATGKVIHVHTVSGQIDNTKNEARNEYQKLHVNGVEIYIAPQMREDREVVSPTLPSSVGENIHQIILQDMRAKSPDKALSDAVDIAIDSLTTKITTNDATAAITATQSQEGNTLQETKTLTPAPKVAEEHHSKPFGWILILISLGGVGFSLYAWRKNEEKKIRKEQTQNTLNKTTEMMKNTSESEVPSKLDTSTKINLAPPTILGAQNTTTPTPGSYQPGPAPYYPPQPQTVIVHEDSGMGGMMTGMMMGEMMAGGHRDHTEIIHDTQIIHDQAPVPAPATAAEEPRQSGGSWSDTSSDPSESGGSWGSSSSSSSSYNSSPSTSGGGWGDSGGSSSSSDSNDSGGGW